MGGAVGHGVRYRRCMKMKQLYWVVGWVLLCLGVKNPSAGKSTRSGQQVRHGGSFPAVGSFSPASKAVGEPGFTLTANGANFETGAVLFFNSAPRPTPVVS